MSVKYFFPFPNQLQKMILLLLKGTFSFILSPTCLFRGLYDRWGFFPSACIIVASSLQYKTLVLIWCCVNKSALNWIACVYYYLFVYLFMLRLNLAFFRLSSCLMLLGNLKKLWIILYILKPASYCQLIHSYDRVFQNDTNFCQHVHQIPGFWFWVYSTS